MKKESVEKPPATDRQRANRFAGELLRWNRYDNDRQMPWKGEKEPYKIWLSEIMLQQTRVEQGLKYYQNFIEAFPDVQALAAAPEARVFKLWEGLGYYSRCRNLHATARHIAAERAGVFPETYEGLLALKGVGSYTAAAIASFAYNLPYAVLDGNVFRVLSRIFDVEVPIDTTRGKKTFSALAQSTLPPESAGAYNQAIMDFGARICRPAPLCGECFFNRHCLAYRGGKQSLLPVKEKKTILKKRWLNYFIVRCGDAFLIRQRTENDIWQGLHEFVLLETDKACSRKRLEALFQKEFGIEAYTIAGEWTEKQHLSHQRVCFRFVDLQLARKKKVAGYAWMERWQLKELAFPRALQKVVGLFVGQ